MNTILYLLILLPSFIYSISLPLKIDYWGKVQHKTWNITTPFALDMTKGEDYDLVLHLPKQAPIPLKKSISKDWENQEQYIFTLEDHSILTNISNTESFSLEIKNHQKVWPFNSRKTKLSYRNNPPKLRLISSSETITHGGAGLAVIESENYEDLNLLAFIDENRIPFYPKRFQQDGFYTVLFSWYTDHSTNWNNQYILAMDTAGNTNILALTDIKPITRNYRQSTINLPKDYAQQKAQELALSQEKAAQLEGNIQEINKVLAEQRTFARWQETRTSFKKNALEIITQTTVFSSPSIPMKQAINTSTYGDRRKYYYQNKLVRQSVHRGLDYASYKNVPIYALLDGVVIYSDWYSGNGKSVIIDHGLNTYSLYAHNSELLAEEGQFVKAGDQISISGTTGQSTGDHLHLSLFVQGMFVEPKEWITQDSIDRLFHQPLVKAKEYIDQQTIITKK
ncbi:MAG: M23 family metallopeptidase [Brevinema sp.]